MDSRLYPLNLAHMGSYPVPPVKRARVGQDTILPHIFSEELSL